MNHADCLSLVHKGAYDAGFLHRNFSPRNIIIDHDSSGLLIDWDLSKPLSVEIETPRRTTRTVHAKESHVISTNMAFIRVPGNLCLVN
jgi:serine/threonine protein kinase